MEESETEGDEVRKKEKERSKENEWTYLPSFCFESPSS